MMTATERQQQNSNTLDSTSATVARWKRRRGGGQTSVMAAAIWQQQSNVIDLMEAEVARQKRCSGGTVVVRYKQNQRQDGRNGCGKNLAWWQRQRQDSSNGGGEMSATATAAAQTWLRLAAEARRQRWWQRKLLNLTYQRKRQHWCGCSSVSKTASTISAAARWQRHSNDLDLTAAASARRKRRRGGSETAAMVAVR